MVKIYDYLDDVLAIKQVKQMQQRKQPHYYASEIMSRMGSASDDELSETLFRTLKICSAMSWLNRNKIGEGYHWQSIIIDLLPQGQPISG